MSMSDATDELHGQLDTGYPHALRPELHRALMARGIDYWVAQGITFWNRDDGCECLAYGYKADGVPKLAIKVVGFTDPAQAIAATLGDTDATRERQGDAGTCRPCPFCGSNAETVHTLNVVPHEPWWIRCPSCGVTTPKYSSETDAIAAWNRRAQ